MRKFTISLPTPSDLGKAARATKNSVSSRVHSDTRLANKVERLRGKLDKAVTDFSAAYSDSAEAIVRERLAEIARLDTVVVPESTCVDITAPADFVPEVPATV